NNANLTSDPTAFSVLADSTAPTTTPSCAPAVACTGWSGTSPVAVTLSPSDGESGVAETRYTEDGSDPTAFSSLYSAPISVSANETVKFRSWDKVGNVEAVGSVTVQIDTSAP